MRITNKHANQVIELLKIFTHCEDKTTINDVFIHLLENDTYMIAYSEYLKNSLGCFTLNRIDLDIFTTREYQRHIKKKLNNLHKIARKEQKK